VPKGVPVRVRPRAPNIFSYKRFRLTKVKFAIGAIWNMLELYLPILIFIVIGLGVGIVSLGASIGLGQVLGVRKPNSEKSSPFECGFEAFEDARMKFDVRYYLVAILFIIFDLEIAFFFPWAVVLDDIGAYGFWAMMIFLGILVVGFLYEWKKGALEWE
jgi:NADH-quinone oxidoreductase subunit A